MILSARSRACLMGAATSDGARAAFAGETPGGTDGDAAVALWHVLSRCPGRDYPEDAVAAAYCAWMARGQGDPSTERAFGLARHQPVKTAARMRADAAGGPVTRGAGALARAPVVAVWGVGRGLSTTEVADVARRDAALSHPSAQCVEANAAYGAMLAHLLRAPGDAAGALAAGAAVARSDEVKAWLASDDAGRADDGVRYALVQTARHLRRPRSYRGGDPAAGVVGAALALGGVPPPSIP